MYLKDIHACVDRVLEGTRRERAERRAVEVNPANAMLLEDLPAIAGIDLPLSLALVTKKLWKPGMTIRYSCDGCGGMRTAKISFIAPRAEFSPPVIYSEGARAKLVFLVEAPLPPSGQPLPPGLPVEVVPQ